MCFCAKKKRMMVGRIVSVMKARIRCHSVPAVDEGDGADGGQNRPRQRQRHVAEEVDVAAAVDQRGFQQFVRKILEEAPQQQDAHRETERHLRQRHPEIGVEQPEVAHLDEQRQHRGRGRKQQTQRQVAQQHGAAEEFHMGKDERRHRCDDQRQRHGQRRDDHRVAQQLPVALREQDVGIVRPFPVMRQPERIDAQFAERLETAEHGRQQRHEHEGGDEREKQRLVEHREVDGRAGRLHVTHRA